MATRLRATRFDKIVIDCQRSTFGYRLGYVMTEPERVSENSPLTQRQILQQALANMHARGVVPHIDVLALGERYAMGEITHQQLLELLCSRTARLFPLQ